MAVLAKILKSYGQMTVQDSEGNSVVWVWDYVNDKAVIKSETIKSKPQISKNGGFLGVYIKVKIKVLRKIFCKGLLF